MNNGKRQSFITPKAFSLATGVKFTTHDKNGKLAGFQSLSTSCLENSRCMARVSAAVKMAEKAYGAEFVKAHPKKAFARLVKDRPGVSICGGCFAVAVQKQYAAVAKNMRKNAEVLQAREIPVSEWPKINAAYFRLESFGDVANVTQVRNYFNFAAANPATSFAVWTKNPDIYARAIKAGAVKPKNLIIILSSVLIGVRASAAKYDFIDKIFTVYRDEDQARAAGVSINCGGRKCLTCLNCYRKNVARVVNELLK